LQTAGSVLPTLRHLKSTRAKPENMLLSIGWVLCPASLSPPLLTNQTEN